MWHIAKDGKKSNTASLTGGVVVNGVGIAVAVIAVAPEQGLVVVVLVPVEGLDLQASALRVTADDTGHGLVHVVGGLCAVAGQVQDLVAHVPPALHTRKLRKQWESKRAYISVEVFI